MICSVMFKFAFVLLTITICCGSANCSLRCQTLPEYLDRPINDSITRINLLLDDTHAKIALKRELTIPTLANMNRGLDHGGQIDAMINVGRYVMRRFLNEVDSRTDLMITKVQERMEEASQSVLSELSETLTPCEFDQLAKSIEELVQQITPELKNLRVWNDARQWDLYNEISRKLLELHDLTCNEREYIYRMEQLLDYGTDYCARYENEISHQEENYLAQIADELRQIVLKAVTINAERYEL